jgi:hypothetical protein
MDYFAISPRVGRQLAIGTSWCCTAHHRDWQDHYLELVGDVTSRDELYITSSKALQVSSAQSTKPSSDIVQRPRQSRDIPGVIPVDAGPTKKR